MALTKREEIYDAEISPLMTQIIAVCKEHDIPLLFSCQLNDDRVGDSDSDGEGEALGPFFCTTRLLPKNSAYKLQQAGRALDPDEPSAWAAYAITTDDAGQEHCEVVASSDDD